MILYFMDRAGTIIGTASTSLTGSLIISSDKKSEDVDSGASTFECDIVFSPDQRLYVESLISVGNIVLRYCADDISRSDNNKSNPSESVSKRRTINGFHDVFTIIETEVDSLNSTINFYAEDGGLDLLNDIADPYTATNKPYSDYAKNALTRTGFDLRDSVAEEHKKTMSIEFKEASNVLQRLNDIATSFEYEFSFGFDILGMSVVDRWVEFTKERGNDTKKVIATDREINNIQIKKTIEKLATALLPTGNDNLSLAGFEYDDGNYYVADQYLLSREALAKWGRFAFDSSNNGGHIYRTYSCGAKDQKSLLDEALKELKKRVEPEINYTIDLAYLPDDVYCGDRINIVDDAGELYLSGRILKLDTSVIDNKKTVTFGEWIIKTSGISDRITELAEAFKAIADNRTFYTWFAYADDEKGNGISLDSTGKKYMGISANRLEEEPDDVSKLNPKDFKWTVIQETDSVDIVNLSITSSKGTMFYKTWVDTTLTAHVYLGGVEITLGDISSRLNSDIVWYAVVDSKPVTEIRNEMSVVIEENSLIKKADYICRLEKKNG